jgi:hypothetical protein
MFASFVDEVRRARQDVAQELAASEKVSAIHCVTATPHQVAA